MTFRFKREGRFFTVRTLVGGDDVTKVQVLEEDAPPPRSESIEASGDQDE